MEDARFDAWTRRRFSYAASGLATLLLGARAISVVEAGKRRKKPDPNAFGCLDAGVGCRGKSALCCSGVCEGKKPKKGKKDKSRCAGHNVLGCTPSQSFCATEVSSCPEAGANFDCFATTGNAGFCADLAAFDRYVNCTACSTDTDCEDQGFPAGSACVIHTGPNCAGVDSCNGVNGSTGTACVPPGG